MIKEIPKSDVVVRPFKVYKEWTLDQTDITPIFGQRIEDSLFDADTDEKSNGYYKRLVYSTIKTQFYRNPATSSVLFEVGLRRNYSSTDERNIDDLINVSDALGNPLTTEDGIEIGVESDTIAVLTIPQSIYGEGIKIGSVVLRDRLRNITYTDDGNSNLISSFDGEVDGNIFYDRGLIVVRGVKDGAAFNSFVLTFNSTMTIYENEIFLNVLENEFNVSQNPTAVYEVDGKKLNIVTNRRDRRLSSNEFTTSSVYQPGVRYIRNKDYPYVSEIDNTKIGSFDDYLNSGSLDPTGSYLAPYITTIGLYDDELNMVAVAKLPRPIKSLPDYPLNFIVRFDT
jgi:hypothetical protein